MVRFSSLWAAARLQLVSSLALLITTSASWGQTPIDWLGGTSNAWATAANWSGGVAPANDVTTNTASFLQATYTNQPNAGTRSIAGLFMGTSAAVTVTSTNLTIGASGIDLSTATNNMTLGTGTYTLGASQTWSVASGRTLAATGIIAMGSNALILNGPGTYTFSGANTSTAGGGVTLNGGTLNANSAGALGSAAGTFTINGGTLAATVATTTNAILQSWNGDFSFGGTQNLNLGAGAVTLGSSRTVTGIASNTLTVSGAVTGAGFSIFKAGTGTLTFGGSLSGITTGGLNIAGGTLRTAANSTYTGDIVVTGGAYEMPGGTYTTVAPYGIGNAGSTTYKNIQISNNAIFRLTGASWNNNVPTATNIGAGAVFTIGSGGATFEVASGITLTVDDGTQPGLVFTATAATSAAQLQGTGDLTKTGTGTLGLSTGSSKFNTFSGAIFVNAGTLSLGGAGNGFPLGTTTVGTTINPTGTLNINSSTSAVITHTTVEPIFLNGGTLTNNSTFNGTSTWAAGSTVTLTANSVLANGATPTTNYNSPFNLNANTLTITTNGGRVQSTGVISGTGSVIVTSTGTGDWVPAGAHTFSGGTTLNGGNTAISVVSVGTVGSVTSGPFGTGTLTLGNGSLRSGTGAGSPFTIINNVNITGNPTFYTVASERSLFIAAPVTLVGASTTITSTVGATVAGTAAVFTGAIGESIPGLGITKAGAGNLVFDGSNTYTGPTTVNAGVLYVRGSQAANTAFTVAAGGNLSLRSGSANPLTSISLLTLGGTGSPATIELELGANTAASDRLVSANAATTANAVSINLSAITGFTAGTFNLVSAASGLSTATYSIANAPGGFTYTLSTSDSLVSVTSATAPGGNLYWRGNINSSWTAFAGGLTNFSTDISGTPASNYSPGPLNTVIFSAANATGTAITSGLDQSFAINDLKFTAAPTGVLTVALTAGPATPNSVPTLTLAPTISTDGVAVGANAGAVSISVPLVLGALQTITVDPTASLTLSGAITGSAANGLMLSGTLTTSGANTYSGSTTINSGSLYIVGATNSTSANSAFTVNGTLRTNGLATAIGSLAGTGTVQNNSTTTNVALTAGSDGSSTTFSGVIQNGATSTLALTKVGAGILTLSGANTYTGATTINGGTIRFAGVSSSNVTVNSGATAQLGSANGLTSANTVSITAGATFDLFGNSGTIGTFTNVATAFVTNTSPTVGGSTATAPGTPSLTDALTLNVSGATVNALVSDGSTRKTQIVLSNANASTVLFANNLNTFSGGIVLANTVAGTRLTIATALTQVASQGNITSSPFGRGPIIVGQSASDKAGVFFGTLGGNTLYNDLTFNTALGTDRFGLRTDFSNTLSGVITANLADAVFSSNTSTGALLITNQITGSNGFVLDVSQTSSANTVLNVTLNNSSGNPSNYAGDTIIGRTNAAPGQNYTTSLILGADNQIPNGSGTGNVVINNNNAFRTGTLNLNGFSETINGLGGNGFVNNTAAGASTLTLGDNNATTTFSGVIQNSGGSVSVVKTGTGVQTFSGANSFTGSLTINAGAIAFTNSSNLGDPNSPLIINGGILRYTPNAATNLEVTRVLSIGASGGTIDIPNSGGMLTVDGGINTGTGNLTKSGPGMVVLAGTTVLNGGAGTIFVNDGTVQTSFGTNGVSHINLSSTGSLQFNNGFAESLTLGTAGTLTLASGARLGFELGAPGLSDQIIIPALGSATVSGTVTLDFYNLGGALAAGSYTLLTGPGGLNTATYTLGTAPNGFNYAIDASIPTAVVLNVTAFDPVYWTAATDALWTTTNPTPNFSTDAAGTTPVNLVSGTGKTVIFSSTAATVVGPSLTSIVEAAYTIDSLQFNNAGTPAVVSIQLDPGTAGALTLNPISSSGGILVSSGVAATIATPLTALAAQTWNVVDATASLTVSGATNFASAMTKTGSGPLSLNGNNTGNGTITLSGGQLNINTTTALGSASLVINAGTTIDSSITAVSLATTNPQTWNGNFTFAGTNSLSFLSGNVTLGNSLTLTTSASSLRVSGIISGTNRTLTKAGAGTLQLDGANTFSGGTVLSGGTLLIGNAAALGSGQFTLSGGNFDNVTGTAATLAGSLPIQINASTTFAGTHSLDLGNGPVSLNVTPTITIAANTLTIGGPASGLGGITKSGAGTLNLNGASTYSGNTAITNGTVNISGSVATTNGSLFVGNTSGNATTLNLIGTGSYITTGGGITIGSAATLSSVVNVGPGQTLSAIQLGGNGGALALGSSTNAVAVVNMTGGTISAGSFLLANAPTGQNVNYGFFNQSGGSFTNVNNATTSRTRLANASGSSIGIYYLSGGTSVILPFSGSGGSNNIEIAGSGTASTSGSSPIGLVYVTGSGQMSASAGVMQLGSTINTGVASIATAQLTIGGSGSTAAGVTMLSVSTSTATAGGGNQGNSTINLLAGGTLTTGNITKQANGSSIINFNGGTLRVGTTGTTFGAQTAVYSYASGATIDTNGLATYLLAAPILAPTADGLASIDIDNGGTGYVGAPAVTISGGNGTGATAIAQINGSGQVTSIVITNPGSGYLNTDSLTYTLSGGGATTPAALLGSTPANFITNTSGGLTKINAGTLILTNASTSTYTGTTTVSAGTLQIGNATATGSLPTGSAIVNNASLVFNRTDAIAQGTHFSGGITGSGSLTHSGTGSVTFTTANTYAGTTTLTNTGAIIISDGGALGNNTLNLNSTSTGTNNTFQLSGGITFSNTIAINANTGRETISSVNGDNTLSSTISINAATATNNTMIFTSDTSGNIFTVSGNITSGSLWTGNVSLRGTGTTGFGTLSGTVTLPAGIFDHNVGGIWTIASTGHTWTQTLMASTVAGSGLKLGVANALPTTVEVLWNATAIGTLDLNGFNQTVAGISSTLATAQITNGAGTTDSTLTLEALAANKTYTAVIADGLSNKINLVMNSAGRIQTLSGANTYTGTTIITAGTLQIGAGGAVGTLSPDSIITVDGTLAFNRTGTMVQGTNFATAGISGSGQFVQSGTVTTTFLANNTYTGTTTIGTGTTLSAGNGGIGGTFGTGAVALAGTLTFNRTDAYTLTAGNIATGAGGIILANTGAVIVTADPAITVTGPLTFGSAANSPNVGTLNLTLGSASFGAATVRTDNDTTPNSIIIGTGKTFTVTGLTIGVNNNATPNVSETNLSVSGAGSLTVNGDVAVAIAQTTADNINLINLAVLDVSALSGFTTSGTNFNVGNGRSTGATANLSNTANSITATTMTVGNSGGNNGAGVGNFVRLGTGTNIIQADTINLGLSKVSGTMSFQSQSPGSPGTVTITNTAGTGGANLIVGSHNGTGTAANIISALDLRGHISTVSVNNLSAGIANNSGTGSASGTISFDSGTFDISSAISLGSKAGGGGGTGTGTLNIGGGAFTVATTSTFVMAGNSTGAGSAVGNFNITGGTATVNVDINKTGGTNTTANITLNGGLLDMTGKSIGSAAQTIAFAAQSGTLQNLAQLNGGGVLTKSSAGTLTLQGNNAYSGGTNLSAGQANLNSATAIGTGTLTILGNTTLDNTSGSPVVLSTNNIQNWNGDFTFAGSHPLNLGTGVVSMDASRIITTTAGTLTVGGAISGTGFGLTKAGAGTLVLTTTSTYTGATTVTAGTLTLTGSASLASSEIAVGIAAVNTAILNVTGLTGGLTLTGTQVLSGFGTVDASAVGVTASGTTKVAPGNLTTVGTLAITGNVILSSAVDIKVATAGAGDLNPVPLGFSTPLTVPNPNHDVLNINGTLNLADLVVNFSSLGATGFDPNQYYSWKIATAEGGIQNNLNATPVVSGTDFLPYASNFSVVTSGNSVYVNFAPVPEPMLLLGVVALTLTAVRRRWSS